MSGTAVTRKDGTAILAVGWDAEQGVVTSGVTGDLDKVYFATGEMHARTFSDGTAVDLSVVPASHEALAGGASDRVLGAFGDIGLFEAFGDEDPEARSPATRDPHPVNLGVALGRVATWWDDSYGVANGSAGSAAVPWEAWWTPRNQSSTDWHDAGGSSDGSTTNGGGICELNLDTGARATVVPDTGIRQAIRDVVPHPGVDGLYAVVGYRDGENSSAGDAGVYLLQRRQGTGTLVPYDWAFRRISNDELDHPRGLAAGWGIGQSPAMVSPGDPEASADHVYAAMAGGGVWDLALAW
jgi:hypothetical protein